MCKIKSFLNKIIYLIILTVILSFTINTCAFANEDELLIEEINTLIEDTATNIKETPIINARHAVVYDRNSRGSAIWQK